MREAEEVSLLETLPPTPRALSGAGDALNGARSSAVGVVRPKPVHRKLSSAQTSAPLTEYRPAAPDGIFVIKILVSEIALQPCQCLQYKARLNRNNLRDGFSFGVKT